MLTIVQWSEHLHLNEEALGSISFSVTTLGVYSLAAEWLTNNIDTDASDEESVCGHAVFPLKLIEVNIMYI